jgi:heme exporter protein B
MTGTSFASKTVALARKDLVVEARGRDTLLPMLVFALTVTMLLAFSLPDPSDTAVTVAPAVGTVALADVVAGFLWVTILFAGLIGFARTFEVERDEGALDALLLVPLDRSGLFAAKAAANLVGLAVIEAVTLPLFALLFELSPGPSWPGLLLVVALVDLGFVSIGTLFSSVAAQTHSRELVLPILALPALVPVFIAAVELTSDLLVGIPLDGVAARGWFGILVAYDVVACVVGALTFEFALD